MDMVNDILKVARFEVTRAQFMVFKHDYIYPPGTDNYPVSNITFEQAKAYCQWLSKLTGQKYDLPAEKEMKTLISKNTSRKTGKKLNRTRPKSPKQLNPIQTVHKSSKKNFKTAFFTQNHALYLHFFRLKIGTFTPIFCLISSESVNSEPNIKTAL